MDDSCIITRPGVGAPVLNTATGVVTPPAPVTVYSAASVGSYDGRSLADSAATGGRCTVSVPGSREPGWRVDGGRQIPDDSSIGKIPVDAPEIREGDTFTVVTSRRDPHLSGRVFRVEHVIESTYAIARKMTLVQP
jgi:hypothetical protein